MARRSGLRSEAAKSMTRLKGHEYNRHVSESLRQINQKAFEDKEKRSDARFAAAGQFLSVMDKMAEAKEQDVKAERGVTQMQKESGVEVQYKKATLGGWMKGENKFLDIGKETFTFGETEYSKADMIAYDKTYQKNKWENIDFDKSGEDIDSSKIKSWTYEEQKRRDKENKKSKMALDKQAVLKQDKLDKANLKEQGLFLAKTAGSAWNKFKSFFISTYGEDKDIEGMDKDRADKEISNKGTGYEKDVVPLTTDEIIEEYTKGSAEDFAANVDNTEGAYVLTNAQKAINDDLSPDNIKKMVSKPPRVDSSRDFWGEFVSNFKDDEGLFQGGEKNRVFGRARDIFTKDKPAPIIPTKAEAERPQTVQKNSNSIASITKSLDKIEEETNKISTAQSYINKNQKFDDNVSNKSKDLFVSMSGRDFDTGTSMYSLYEGDNMILENAFQIKIDPDTKLNTRELSSLNPILKGWAGFYGLKGMNDIGNALQKSRNKKG